MIQTSKVLNLGGVITTITTILPDYMKLKRIFINKIRTRNTFERLD